MPQDQLLTDSCPPALPDEGPRHQTSATGTIFPGKHLLFCGPGGDKREGMVPESLSLGIAGDDSAEAPWRGSGRLRTEALRDAHAPCPQLASLTCSPQLLQSVFWSQALSSQE